MKLRAPLLSARASGTLADTLTYKTSKGRSLVTNRPHPSNPNSTLQQDQRNHVKDAANFWRYFMTDPDARQAWNTYALARRIRAGGYHLFIDNAIYSLLQFSDAAVAVAAVPADAGAVTFTVIKIEDGTAPTEAGDWQVFAGPHPEQLRWVSSHSLVGMDITSGTLGAIGDVVYVQLYKSLNARSGIHRITLINPSGESASIVDHLTVRGDLTVLGTLSGVRTYVNRGALAAYDFVAADYTRDSLFHHLDLSAILPVGAYAAHIRVMTRAGVVDVTAAWQYPTGAENWNRVLATCQNTSYNQYTEGILQVDSDRHLEYAINANFSTLNTAIPGYII